MGPLPQVRSATTLRMRRVERHTDDVRAKVIEAKIEDDEGIHLVVASRRYPPQDDRRVPQPQLHRLGLRAGRDLGGAS